MGDASAEAWLLLATGELDLEENHLKSAEELSSQAQSTFRRYGNKTGLLWALHRRGEIAHRNGSNEQARLYFEECLVLARQLQNKIAIDSAESALKQVIS